MGFFEHLAAFDDSEREQERTATAVANRRAEARFGSFVRSAVDANDRKARLDLIDDELREVVANVVSEYGGDPSRIEASLRTKFAMDPYGPMGDASVAAPPMPGEGAVATPGPGADMQAGAGLHPCAQGHPNCAATPGGGCSQSVGMQQEPGLGGFGTPMSDRGPFYARTAEFITEDEARAAAGEDGPVAPLFGDRAPETQHRPDAEQSFESIDKELDNAPSAVGHGHQSAIDPHTLVGLGLGLDGARRVRNVNNTINGNTPCDQCGAPGAQLTNQGKLCQGCYEANGAGDPSMMDKAKYILKGGSDSTGLSDTPEPKTDHKTWKPNALGDGNLDVIDTDGGRYKTEHQDVTDKAEYKSQSEEGDSFKADSPVVKHEELPSEKDNSGFQDGGEAHGDHTDTWSGKGGQANPVTRETVATSLPPQAPQMGQQGTGTCPDCGSPMQGGSCPNCGSSYGGTQGSGYMASVDVDKNPLREIIESEFNGFLPATQVQQAIASYKQAKSDEDKCSECGASLDDGEGYDGLCGNCADRAEANGKYK